MFGNIYEFRIKLLIYNFLNSSNKKNIVFIYTSQWRIRSDIFKTNTIRKMY